MDTHISISKSVLNDAGYSISKHLTISAITLEIQVSHFINFHEAISKYQRFANVRFAGVNSGYLQAGQALWIDIYRKSDLQNPISVLQTITGSGGLITEFCRFSKDCSPVKNSLLFHQ